MAFQIPKPEITLFFDGSTSGGNPGVGGAAAVFQIDGKRNDNAIAPTSNRMGIVGNNCAEYYGLILGLRELLHVYPMMEYSLIIKGDSELVIKQLKGEYQVRDEVLKNYYFVARGLLARITKAGGSSIKLIHIPREQNQEADALANQAAVLKISPNLRFWHYPCLNSLLDGTIEGTKCSLPVKVAHDHMAAGFTPEIHIDAAILRQCYGDDALEIIRSTGKKNLIEGKSAMTVLGVTTLQFTFGHGNIKVYNAFVVDFLPWPLQISMKHPACSWDEVFGRGGRCTITSMPNWKTLVPQRFKSHPYWTSDVIVIGGV